jgi:hypothetical protein
VHSFVGFRQAIKRIPFDHRVHAIQGTELHRVLRILAVPEYQPATELRFVIKEKTLIVSGSAGAAGTNNLALGANPSTRIEIACAFGAIARMTLAPPRFCNSDTTSCAVASM